MLLRIHFGPKITGNISIVFEDLSGIFSNRSEALPVSDGVDRYTLVFFQFSFIGPSCMR